MTRHPRPRVPRRGLHRTFVSAIARPGLAAAALVGLFLPASASESTEPDASIVLAMPHRAATADGTFPTSSSNCAGAACDTVWIGHSSAGPGGAFLGVHVGGVWDFDTSAAGTDSTQGWRRWALHYRSGSTRPAASRPSGRSTTATRSTMATRTCGPPATWRAARTCDRRRRRVALGHDGGPEVQRLQRRANRRRLRSPARARPGAACGPPATSRRRMPSPEIT